MPNRGMRGSVLFIAGLMGVFGVAAAAAASHGTDPRLLGGASAMCLAHAPALVALHAGWAHFRTAAASALLLAAGTAVFAADLALRHFLGHGLFPMSAPLGGLMMMGGWLAVAMGAFLPRKETAQAPSTTV
ncbi:DUF423 domain-containing protein [Sinorhizobium fredii]|uniref:DUF423 domain-containing protein n=2 Tax=Rhizobium fredii TaxID=380 RepID=A0A2A6M2Q9_RHIFR|nr:DUF423 domain-containing protein [Sinorhizobium fredii]KSV91719.1 membrane protein [Sinorhizobium fredii USDA 205]MCG5475443.1 DUF423 domain-containing protein [Sinorhizobium fredii]MQW99206.1 DUF423 domain-containing protein [Sinorhizobium fredii]MQX09184.1 DUF423 domain-containing protein [Sinorhizobium fredii]PDT48850.1 DUF423 domain-containing protein [Sinorhizobium fredii]